MFSNKQIFAIHRWLGLLGGAFIVLIAVTGTLLLFASEIDAVRVAPNGQRKGYEFLLREVQRQHSGAQPLSWRLYSQEPTRAIRAEMLLDGERWWLYVNPYTGSTVKAVRREEAFVRRVLELHEHLLLGFTGHIIMGLVGLSLLGSAVTGFIYYRKFILQVFRTGVRWRKNSYIVNSDLHKLLGVSALLFMLLMASTGIFFHWESIERRLDSPKPQEKAEEPAKTPPPAAAKPISPDALLILALNAVPNFTPEQIQFPQRPGDGYQVQGITPERQRMFGKYDTRISVDANGQVTEVFRTSQADAEFKAEHTVEELHFGQYGGWFTKILYALCAVATLTVTITGFVIWWKKR